jgi:Zn-dependent M32 family carboxypeptidase
MASLGWNRRKGTMASLTNRIMKFVQSPQGQQLIERAKVEASKPENRRKLERLRARYLDKRR